MDSSRRDISEPIYIRNIVVEGDDTHIRLATDEVGPYDAISRLMKIASQQHRENNCEPDDNNRLKPGNENNITRVVTNEFLFYTQAPLTIAEFQNLQQKIADLAKQQPPNLHMVLGTFAVLTPDGKLMNVAAQVESGPNPKINLTVKNIPTSFDPAYYSSQSSSYHQTVDIRNGDNISNLGIQIDGQHCPFSFNNIFHCVTAGGESFYSCIEICMDHQLGVAKKRLSSKLEAEMKQNIMLSTKCSHIVISNTTTIIENNLLGNVTHADPANPKRKLKNFVKTDRDVGQSVSLRIQTTPTDQLPLDILQDVIEHNKKVEGKVGVQVPNVSLSTTAKMVSLLQHKKHDETIKLLEDISAQMENLKNEGGYTKSKWKDYTSRYPKKYRLMQTLSSYLQGGANIDELSLSVELNSSYDEGIGRSKTGKLLDRALKLNGVMLTEFKGNKLYEVKLKTLKQEIDDQIQQIKIDGGYHSQMGEYLFKNTKGPYEYRYNFLIAMQAYLDNQNLGELQKVIAQNPRYNEDWRQSKTGALLERALSLKNELFVEEESVPKNKQDKVAPKESLPRPEGTGIKRNN